MIYLDNSATTVCEPGVVEKVVHMMSIAYGNPSAMHNKGVEAENYIKEAKEIIKKHTVDKGAGNGTWDFNAEFIAFMNRHRVK